MTEENIPTELSHVGPAGEARMVDVSEKSITSREAIATAVVSMKADVMDAIFNGSLPKGDAIATARIAGIQAAKKTGELIPLCHPLPLDCVRINFERKGSNLLITCSAKTVAKTGVEMEVLCGVSAAALTLYDMAKAADKSITIGPIQLERKPGGKSGTYQRS